MEPRLLTIDEASQYLSLHPKTIYFMARKGELPVVKVGRAVRFDRIALDHWIEKVAGQQNPEAVAFG
jgi:excisionase family DNA binding protein